MNRWIRIVERIYTWLLRLYPRRFRTMFKDEMCGVFMQHLGDAAQHGKIQALRVCWMELKTFPINLWQTHRYEQKEKNVNRMRTDLGTLGGITKTRWLVRFASLLWIIPITGFSLDVLDTQTLTLLFLISLCLLSAWRWEIKGGQSTIILSLAFGVIVSLDVFLLTQDEAVGVRILCMLLGVLWMIPTLILGWLFLRVGQCADALNTHHSS